MKNSVERNSNIELVRIISIILITISHYCCLGVGRARIDALSPGINKFLLTFLILGNLGTILFIIISGYFLINSDEVKIKKLLRIIFQVLFYSITIFLAVIILKLKPYSKDLLFPSIFPITYKAYWFMTCYIILYIFHPYINKCLNNLNRKEHFKLNILLFVIFSLLATLSVKDYYGNELIQFILYYSIGAYLYKYPKNILGEKHNNYKILVSSLILIMLSIIVLEHLPDFREYMNIRSDYLLSRESPLAILLCVSLFDIFSRMKPKSNKVINFIASMVLAVYLIPTHRLILRAVWRRLFKVGRFYNTPYLIPHLLLSILIVVIVSLIIEILRKYILEKPIFKVLDPKLDKLQKKLN